MDVILTVFYCMVFSLICSNTYRSHHLQRSKLNFCILRVAQISQNAETAGTGANGQEETTASESTTRVKNLVANAVKECLADITAGFAAAVNDTIKGKFMSCKRQCIDESASSVESALKNVKRDPHRFNKKCMSNNFAIWKPC